MLNGILAVALAYLLGSIPSAYIIGRVWGKIDLRMEGEGHISATAVFRHMGKRGLAAVLIMDVGKSVFALYFASMLQVPLPVFLLAAYMVVIGHCWSVFLKFNGGLGALVMFGVLGYLGWWEFMAAGIAAGVLTLVTKKSSLSTFILMIVFAAVMLVESRDLLIILFPFGLVAIHYLRHLQTRRHSSEYKNELFSDLRRIK